MTVTNPPSPRRLRPLPASSRYLCCCLCLLLTCGCGLISRRYPSISPDSSDQAALPNPVVVPVHDAEFAWNQIVDMVDDYFEVMREIRVQEVGGVLTEGRIETQPLIGATCLEPLRRDSTPGYERWHSTFQTIRRRATLRVIPVAAGFEIYLTVQKEIEDVSQPAFSNVGQAVRRHDGSLVSSRGLRDTAPVTLGWIPLGRDQSLEQEMLRQLRARLFEVAETAAAPSAWMP